MSLSGSVKMLKSNGCNLSDSGSTRSTKFRFLSWSPETYPLREFINMFPLPRVVRITNSEDAALLKALILPADVDITQPLLLYKKYRTVKVMGKCLKIQKNGKLKENGPCVVIPDSFPGWFTLLNQEGKECAMTLTSMGQVAAARVPAFLTKFDVPVYKLTDSNDPNSKSVYVRSTMKGGSILRLLGVWADLGGANKGFTAPPSYSSSQKSSCFLGGSLGGFGGRLVARSLSSSQPPQFQYVQCLSLENEVLFIPFSAAGVFYPIAPRGGRNPQHVYPLSAIARISRLPLRTKMVFGAAPSSLPDFTGALQIESVDTEDVILACTLLRDKPVLFEIDLDCDLSLSQMTSEDLFIQSTSYQAALTFCKAEADNWRRQIRPTLWGKNTTKGTISGAYLLSVKEKKKSLRLHSSPQTPSKLSLLFRPNSAPFGNAKDALRRSKSFNVEVQSVSISLTQDEEEEETKKLSTLFNFMAGKKSKASKEKQQQQLQLHNQQHVPAAVASPLPPALLSPPSLHHNRHLFSFSEQPLSLPCNIMTSEKDLQKDKDQQELVVQHSQVSKLPQPVHQHPKSTSQLSGSHQGLNSKSTQQLSHHHHNGIHSSSQNYPVQQQPASKKLQIFSNQPKSISHLSNNYHHALRRRQLLNRSVPDVLSNHNSSSSSSIPTITSSSSTSNTNINNTNHHANQNNMMNESSSFFSSKNNNNRISIITGSNGSSSCSNICSSSGSFPSSNNSTGCSSSSSGSISGPCSKIIISNNSKKMSSSSTSSLNSTSINNNNGCINSNVGKTSCIGSHHHLLHLSHAPPQPPPPTAGGHHNAHAKGSGNGKGSNGEVPYGTVLDDVTEEENIYAEISDAFTLKLDLNPIHQMGIDFHHHMHRHPNSSNMSSLVKGGGGSDGAFSGTLSGTFSSSNPSSREEDIYDAVF